MNELRFDVVLHLAGEQILPNYMAMKLCESPNHIILFSEKTKRQLERLQAEFTGSKLIPVIVDPFDYHGILSALINKVKSPANIGFNVTGGTKPMSVAAIDFCRTSKATPFYIDTSSRKIFFFKEPFQQLDMPPVFDDVEVFIRLAGYRVQNPGIGINHLTVTSRRELVDLLFSDHYLARRHLPEIAKFNNQKLQNQKGAHADWEKLLQTVFHEFSNKGLALTEQWDQAFPAGYDWRKSCTFLAGGWFEEYCLWNVANQYPSARMGIMPGWIDARTNDPRNAAQEFDVAFTDGYNLAIMECKSGSIKQEYVQKLENLVSVFGGAFGKGIMASLNRPDPQTLHRIRRSLTSVCIHGDGLTDIPTVMELARANENHIYPVIVGSSHWPPPKQRTV